ncbi:hypothetical protein AYR62_03060 [Secundilactobacillus paracollinoides]|uniref:Uncharacterized protein n=1 Tax=Secundilactobacillus paracollinoides TaxID=240427 RepID=A0A1B2J217_9LACO|nr:hypothetical protein AYR61_14310 [Secundilactobacillus paracollinoides]ANZ63176.1 hypothetical protein AYR62_03060 [Secundilactobacillus paracollinoides]ANZ68340.1 hypothetical protein AYR63_15210 [Secundilactobacillus paracollinoides]
MEKLKNAVNSPFQKNAWFFGLLVTFLSISCNVLVLIVTHADTVIVAGIESNSGHLVNKDLITSITELTTSMNNAITTIGTVFAFLLIFSALFTVYEVNLNHRRILVLNQLFK